MTGRRCKSVRGLVLAAVFASACAGGLGPARPRFLLEAPPPSKDLVGRLEVRVARGEDTLVDLAPALGVGYVELLAANPGIDPWLPPRGARLLVPRARLLPSGRRDGIVVNLGDLRLYHFAKNGAVRSYPIGIAKDGYATPMGETVVKGKREHPDWIPGPSARRDDPSLPERIKPGPDNPLGEHALYLAWATYLIHGTNEPRGVGRHSSRGCIRLYPDNIAELYGLVGPGTKVRVVNEIARHPARAEHRLHDLQVPVGLAQDTHDRRRQHVCDGLHRLGARRGRVEDPIMGHHAEELVEGRPEERVRRRALAQGFEQREGLLVVRGATAMRVDQDVRVESDHPRSMRSKSLSRSARSTPGRRRPSTVLSRNVYGGPRRA
jgi:lipoprotein-anchoring transpeptidase ErfK/SrfK